MNGNFEFKLADNDTTICQLFKDGNNIAIQYRSDIIDLSGCDTERLLKLFLDYLNICTKQD